MRGPMIFKYGRVFAVCPRAEEHYEVRLSLQPLTQPQTEPSSGPSMREGPPFSHGPSKIVKLSNRHRFKPFLVSLNQIQSPKHEDLTKNFGPKKLKTS